MNIRDTFAKLLPSAQPSITVLRRSLADIEAAITEAESQADVERDRHDRAVVELLANADPARLIASRSQVQNARLRVAELGAARTQTAARLDAALQAEHAAEMRKVWATTRQKLEARQAAVRRLQDALDCVGDALAEVTELSEAAYQAAPIKPEYRPRAFLPSELLARANLRLYGNTDGKLGRGTSVHGARTAPDLTHFTADGAAALLALANAPENASPVEALS